MKYSDFQPMMLLIPVVSLLLVSCSKQEAIDIQGDNEIVVRVNEKPLTKNQMHCEMVNLLLSVGSDMPAQLLQQKETEFELQAIQNLINTELLVEEALRRGLTISEEEVDMQINGLRAAYESMETYSLELEIRALTDEELTEEARRGLLVEKLLDQELQIIQSPSDEEIEEFYNQNKEVLRRPEQVLVSHILIQTHPDDSDGVREAKREELETLRSDIENGADFGDIASRYSNCPSSQRRGNLGWLQREQLPAELSDPAFTLDKGSLSPVLETADGFHLIRIEDHRPALLPQLNDIHDDILLYVLDLHRRSAIQSLIEQLRSSASIEIVPVS
ncbi:peptidylprolyl isomerase [bacterium]|nr:peptidylprolyl isomerase [candidate division CSSED10-310 bacterium]